MKLINLDDALVAIASTNGSKGDMLWALYDLPNVDSRPKGKWTDRNGRMVYPEWERYRCSVCGQDSDRYNYCPHCGADMRGNENEID